MTEEKIENKIGIMDPEGLNSNPLDPETPYSDEYKRLGQIWSKFPAYGKAVDIIKSFQDHQVTLITSGTGSGKTVLVPKFLLHHFDYEKKIAITLPKQIITQSAAEFAAKTLDVKLGKQVGYKYRGSPKQHYGSQNRLVYATDGTIVSKLIRDEVLSEFDGVVIDEAHERKIQIDFLLYLLRNLLKKRPEFKVVIMSATINTKIFADYFRDFKYHHLDVGGKTNYPIKSIFLPKTPEPPAYLEEGMKIITKLLEQPITDADKDNPDILFFITSSNEAFDLCRKVGRLDPKNGYCIEVYAGMEKERQELAQDKLQYKSLGEYQRKVVIATNVAESSLTVDGIGYVIDSGFEYSSSYDPIRKARRLEKQLITHAQAKQRMGRAGRTAPGVCYHLYSEHDFKKMDRFPTPDIRKNSLVSEILSLLQLPGITDCQKLVKILTQFIEPPREEYVKDGIQQLVQLGAIDRLKLTPFGQLMAQTSLDPPMAVAVLNSFLYRCNRSMIKIAALIDASKGQMSNFFLPASILLKKLDQSDQNAYRKAVDKMQQKIDKAIDRLHHRTGDHLTMLRIYDKYFELLEKSNKKADDWAFKNFIKVDTLIKAKKYHRRISGRLRGVNLPIARKQQRETEDKTKTEVQEKISENTTPEWQMIPRENIMAMEIEDRIMFCLFTGFRGFIATKVRGSDDYKIPYDPKFRCRLSDNTTLPTNPAVVLYHELFISAEYQELNIITKLSKKMLEN